VPGLDGDALRARLDDARLYLCTDARRRTGDLAAFADAALAGGVDIVQLRDKGSDGTLEAREELAALEVLAEACARHGALLAVNDRADVALAAGAHGVHVGVDDPSAAALRRIVPSGFVIGASVGDDGDVARAAGADYVGIGPVYPVAIRGDEGESMGPERFAVLAARCGVPAVAIGGITPDNAAAMIAVGAAGVAVISALFGAPEPARAARLLRAALDASGR
jgi:thiamine-phosphate pyrophosphorylase